MKRHLIFLCCIWFIIGGCSSLAVYCFVRTYGLHRLNHSLEDSIGVNKDGLTGVKSTGDTTHWNDSLLDSIKQTQK